MWPNVIQTPNYCPFISMDPEFWLLAFKLSENYSQYRDDDDDSVKTQGCPILFRDLCWMAQRHRTRYGSGAMERSAVEEHVIALYSNTVFPILPDSCREQRLLPTEAQHTEAWEKLEFVGPSVDPRRFRLSIHGDVLDRRADVGSPLKAHLDHVFPVARGGQTLSPNLRYISCLTNHKKGTKLECFWAREDLACGVNRNLFLMTLETTNCDFRARSLSFLFLQGEDDAAALCHGMQKFGPQRRDPSKRVVAVRAPPVTTPDSNSDRKNVHFTHQQSLDIVLGRHLYSGADVADGKIWKKIQGRFCSLANKSNADISNKYRNIKNSGALDHILSELGLGESPVLAARCGAESDTGSSHPVAPRQQPLSPLREVDMNAESDSRIGRIASPDAYDGIRVNGRREFRRYVHMLKSR